MARYHCYHLQPFKGLPGYIFVSRKAHSFAGSGVTVANHWLITAKSALAAELIAYSKLK
jgi:hypothetical protein